MAEILTHPTAALGSRPDISTYRAPTPEGLRAWLPALVVLIGMPLLALTTTKYVTIQPMQRMIHASTAAATENAVAVVSLKRTMAGGASGHGLNSNILLILSNGAFKSEIVNNQDKLSTLAAAALKSATPAELSEPGAQSAFRTQLMADLNSALGGAFIHELYIAGWPTQ